MLGSNRQLSENTMAERHGHMTWTVAALTFATCSTLWYLHHRQVVRNLERKWVRERQAERTGRIRAEVKLRQASKQIVDDSDLTLKRIGTVVSPYTKRMGTPRQGALVPASRAFVAVNVPMESLEGIDQYSHAWIIFEFHANTDLVASKKTKIRPPRGGGIKVGQLATRSPHRPNAIGLSLVKVERLDLPNRRFYVSAIDLVNGTPVYDIKPYVPWDMPGKFDGLPFKAPTWVEDDDSLSHVVFTATAERDLKDVMSRQLMAPLYTSKNNGFEGAIETLKQVLAQDPRASRKRGTSTHRSEASYKIAFCQTQVEFRVADGNVEVIKLDGANYNDGDYVDGIPLAKSVEKTKNVTI